MESQIEKTAKHVFGKFGKTAAIIYCDGVISGVEESLALFEDNGSYAILNDWEDEFYDISQYWKDVKDYIEKNYH